MADSHRRQGAHLRAEEGEHRARPGQPRARAQAGQDGRDRQVGDDHREHGDVGAEVARGRQRRGVRMQRRRHGNRQEQHRIPHRHAAVRQRLQPQARGELRRRSGVEHDRRPPASRAQNERDRK